MAWNRSENGTEKGRRRTASGPVTGSLRARAYFLFAVGVLLLAGGAWILLSQTSRSRSDIDSEVRKTGAGGLIAEAKPAAAPKAEKTEPATPRPRLSPTQVMGRRGMPIETYGFKTYWTNGVLRYESGQRVYDPNRPSEKISLRPPVLEVFKHSSLNAIASLITISPGDLLVGDLEYGDEFIIDFNDSLTEPIEYEEGDTEYTRQVKDAVKEARKNLYEMMNQGKDIAEAMNDARSDLRNLSLHRQEIMAMVAETAEDESAADDDVADIITAANALFREKGIKEIGDNEFVRWSLIMEKRRGEKADSPEQ